MVPDLDRIKSLSEWRGMKEGKKEQQKKHLDKRAEEERKQEQKGRKKAGVHSLWALLFERVSLN